MAYITRRKQKDLLKNKQVTDLKARIKIMEQTIAKLQQENKQLKDNEEKVVSLIHDFSQSLAQAQETKDELREQLFQFKVKEKERQVQFEKELALMRKNSKRIRERSL